MPIRNSKLNLISCYQNISDRRGKYRIRGSKQEMEEIQKNKKWGKNQTKERNKETWEKANIHIKLILKSKNNNELGLYLYWPNHN